jgi:hypothetical protein
MNIFKKLQIKPYRLVLRLLCVLAYACMFASASSLHADLEYLGKVTEETNNHLVIELVESKSDDIHSDNALKNFNTYSNHFLTYVNLPFRFETEKQCSSASQSHFDHCFNFVSANKARLLKYLKRLSVLPL